MRLLDGIMGAIGGGQGAEGLDLNQLISHLGDGNLQNIVSQFEQGGLGNVVQSWVGTGANLPISAEQLQSVLGNEQVAGIAKSLGIDTAQVANVLPGLIDHLTPDGQMSGGNLLESLTQAATSGGLGNILGGLMGKV